MMGVMVMMVAVVEMESDVYEVVVKIMVMDSVIISSGGDSSDGSGG